MTRIKQAHIKPSLEKTAQPRNRPFNSVATERNTMKVSSKLHDGRINAWNILLEIKIGDYEELVAGVLTNNVYQRKRVGSSKTVYSLLREDLKRGCIIPPVVLALTNSATDASRIDDSELSEYIKENAQDLIILDGLQRTYTILDLLKELRRSEDEQGLKEVLSATIRIEIYIGINRLGILYRMLTLNTGQTPMSLRQQIEMLYLGYLDKDIEGIQLVREADGTTANGPGKYNFKDVIDGFNAYLDRDELPIWLGPRKVVQ
ncbi:hypothetical protein [Arthrobacter sp. YC-RL1]|uniref:hypothetical protein n=1 Tax=Arthrobacter sp. YC-RL1 TaxID=1652545 RepID=UPI000B11F436|nr:hypothetical protein [Arthrobacter sp. YC-RL1]